MVTDNEAVRFPAYVVSFEKIGQFLIVVFHAYLWNDRVYRFVGCKEVVFWILGR